MARSSSLIPRAGTDYSLTLHGPGGEAQDHWHRLGTVRPYEYEDAATLLADFWAEVDEVLKERGVVQ